MIEALLSLAGLVALGGFLLWAASGKTIYEAHGSGIIEAIPGVADEAPHTPEEILILSCNLGYGLGGQRAAEPAVIYDRLDQLLECIALSGAEIVALQEVDFASQRSGHIDQLHYLAAALGWKYVARVFTWECRYLPTPWWQPWHYAGKVRAGQGVISRYPLVQNARQRLPQAAAQPLWAPLFEPHHTVQMVEILCGERTIRLFHGTMDQTPEALRQRQAQELVTFVRDTATPNCLVVGTFSAPEHALETIATALRDRLRLVPPAGTTPLAPERFAVPVLVGPGLRIATSEVFSLPEALHAPFLVTVHWALPPGQASGDNHSFRVL